MSCVCRIRETNTCWREGTCLTRTSVMILTLMEISDQYGSLIIIIISIIVDFCDDVSVILMGVFSSLQQNTSLEAIVQVRMRSETWMMLCFSRKWWCERSCVCRMRPVITRAFSWALCRLRGECSLVFQAVFGRRCYPARVMWNMNFPPHLSGSCCRVIATLL